MNDLKMLTLDYPLSEGAIGSGIATIDSLRGGPPSTDLTEVFPEARSAIVFAVPLDQRLIDPFLNKTDRLSHERDNIRTNNVAAGIAVGLADYLRQKGIQSTAISPNKVYRPAELKKGLMLPDISLRYLAVAAGVGHFGLSGNVITKEYGAGVILAAVVTAADFPATSPLPVEENYCDRCGLCLASCASGFMHATEEQTVTLGGVQYTYSKRRSQLRCQFVCGGFSGLHQSGKWSSWSPGRWAVPESDENILSALMPGFKAYYEWPEIEGGQYHVMMRKKLLLTCGNCQLVCMPAKNERLRRHRLLVRSGVVVQRKDGRLDAVSADEAKRYVESLEPERKALYRA
jgi:epoxyqueuosine reductase QueG